MAGIYIHVPFCKKACHYCNFHFSTNLASKALLLDAICMEINLKHELFKQETVESIYFGGGTPSMLNDSELNQIFDALHQHFTVTKNAEITLEANPDDLDKEIIRNLKNTGINRLSIGVQSFFDADLTWMGRAHTADQAVSCIMEAQDAGFYNLSIDLIYGSPTTTHRMWAENLQKTISLKIPHISSYCLTVEERTVLSHQIKKGKTQAPDLDFASDQFGMLMQTLEDSNYDHYEISNFAKEGFIAIHNTNYWKGIPYLGFGPSAHSYINEKRSWNIAHNHKYIESIEKGMIPETFEMLTADMKYNEYIMTGLRTKWGINKAKLAEMGSVYSTHINRNIQRTLQHALIVETEKDFKLTREGKYFADRIAMELFIAD
jgi:oxygen-independent coproporphyrinogen-3 oxidase